MLKTVVIIGGGFGGVRAALDLSRHKYDLKVVLIDKGGYHSYPPDYYKLLSPSHKSGGHFDASKFRLMFSAVSIQLHEIFEGHENVELVIDEALGFNAKEKTVKLASNDKIKYDWLILATGSATNFYDIPGLRSRAFEFKTAESALNLRNAIDEVFERKGKHEMINIVVGGGGFTGAEIVSSIAVFADELSGIHGHPRENVSVSIIEASSNILSSLSDWARKKTEDRLKKLGVKLFVSDPVIEVYDNVVSLKSKKQIDYDILVWTAGVKANSLAGKMPGVKLNKGLCVIVNEHLCPGASRNVYVIGDISHCEAFEDNPLPMTAQTAISQGVYVAYSIKRQLHGRKVFKYYPRQSRFILPLGGRYAVADLGWFKTSGFAAWLLKRIVALQYFLSILPFRKAVKIWLYGAKF